MSMTGSKTPTQRNCLDMDVDLRWLGIQAGWTGRTGVYIIQHPPMQPTETVPSTSPRPMLLLKNVQVLAGGWDAYRRSPTHSPLGPFCCAVVMGRAAYL